MLDLDLESRISWGSASITWSCWSWSSSSKYETCNKSSSSKMWGRVFIPSYALDGGASHYWSSSNWTLRSMKHFLVATSIDLYAFPSFAYPSRMHSLLWAWKAFLLLIGILAQDLEPKTLKWETSGLFPCSASNGVAPTTELWGTLLCKYKQNLQLLPKEKEGDSWHGEDKLPSPLMIYFSF